MRTRLPDRAAQEHPAAPPLNPTPPCPVPAPSAMSGSTRKQRLQALLRDLGPDILQGPESAGHENPLLCPTGLPQVDNLLGGGIPCGKLSELAGPASSGRTSLALSLISEATRTGHCVGWVDLNDAFDPVSARDAQVVLERVLWVRPRHLSDALRCTERLLETEGFPLVVLDVAARAAHQVPHREHASRKGSPGRPPDRDPNAWLRLSRITAGTQSALAVLTKERLTGSSAHISLELRPGLTRWSKGQGLLEGLETEVMLARHRAAPAGRSVRLHAGNPNERAA